MRTIRRLLLLALLTAPALVLAGCAGGEIRSQTVSNEADASERASLERDLSMYSD